MDIPHKNELKFILLHNFSDKELSLILSRIKALYPDRDERNKLVFAKTTIQSKKMNVQELIDDVSEDHLYLLKTPPPRPSASSHTS